MGSPLGSRAGYGELNTAVLSASLRRVVRCDRISIPKASRRDQVRVDSLGDEEIGDGLRSFQRKLLVAVHPLRAQFGTDWNIVRIAGHDDRGLLEGRQDRSHFGDRLSR